MKNNHRVLKIDTNLLDTIIQQARNLKRKRLSISYSDPSESLQILLSSINPGSYIQPHMHAIPNKIEMFMIIQGKICVVIFDDCGEIISHHILSSDDTKVIEIFPYTWHTVFAILPETIFYEIKSGPFDPDIDKKFAIWAPREDETNEGDKYLENLWKLVII
jgi:cupin fold WbuC family metalloprotein